MCKQFWTNGTAIASGAAAEPTKVECLYGNGKSGGNILWGAEQNAKGNGADKGFSGAMEEMFLSRLSLENITAHLFSCPGCGCNNCKCTRVAYYFEASKRNGCTVYIWDYTNPKARAFWANGTASLFNEAGAEASQWDGTDSECSKGRLRL